MELSVRLDFSQFEQPAIDQITNMGEHGIAALNFPVLLGPRGWM